MKFLIFTLLISYSSISHAQIDSKHSFDELLMNISEEKPGAIVTIVKNGKILFSKAKGLANMENKIAITTSSEFRLSSTSKQFTAACILHLSQNKHLKLTDPISKYFPEYSYKIGQVTIQELLHHTSGIRDYMSLLMIQGSRSMDNFNNYMGGDEELEKLISNQTELAFDSGTKHSYSNTNYWILSRLVDKVSGISLGTYAKKHIFEPLKMHSTSFVEDNSRNSTNEAIGYLSPCPDCEIHPYTYTSTAVGDGGVRTNTLDLLHWENEFYNHKILTAESWKIMTRPGVLKSGEDISYACGLVIGQHKGQSVIKHSGQNPGFSSEILRFPLDSLSVIVLANQNWHDTRNLATSAADIFLNLDRSINETCSKTKIESAVLTKDELDRFSGDYVYPETGEKRSIKNTPNGLLYIRNNGPSSKLIPLSKSILTYEERPHVTMKFSFLSETETQIEWSDGTRSLLGKTHLPLHYSEQKLQNYVGKYFNSELNVALELALDASQLSMAMTGQTFPLEPVKNDEFSAMGIIKLRFTRDQNGKLNGYRLDAPRAENINFILVGE